MSFIRNIFANLFARTPERHESGYGPVYAAVVSRLERTGVRVGKTAGYPRVEVHSITEGERLDKEGQLRQVSFTVESIGNASLGATAAVNEENIERLTSELVLPEGWRCLGVVPDQLQDLTESADSAKIIYRLLQTFTAWVERVKADPEPDPQTEPGTNTGGDEPGEPSDPVPVEPGDDPIVDEPPIHTNTPQDDAPQDYEPHEQVPDEPVGGQEEDNQP